ncbi:MAG: M28 family peptidase [Phaeodactylibacter sp.]|nr:M28 family peptidase [Phaeodactylibacter sp.]MCB9266278.1 M28 family peptidase [Lewinellaceae bacterium]
MQFRRTLLSFALAGLLVAGLSGCQSDGSGQSSTEEAPPREKVPVPRFERDSAYAFVEKQVDFGPRVPNTEAHRQCKQWLVSQFKSFGAKVTEQDFQAAAYTGETLKATNIIAQFNPDATRRILLAAHWDSRPFADSPLSEERTDEAILGADDGGSGVAVLMEVARQLQAHPIELGIDIVLFDAEDYGESGGERADTYALGSQHWARNPHVSGKQRPKYGILLDMVGARNARFPKEYYSVQFAPNVVRKAWKLAQDMGYGNYFVNEDGGAITDDHYFVNTIARIPMIDIINRQTGTQTGFGEHWHTHDDNIDIIDPRTLRAVGQVMLAVVYREANGEF